MKKIKNIVLGLSLLLFTALSFESKAQAVMAKDTTVILNTKTMHLTYDIPNKTNLIGVGLQIYILRNSGSAAGGKCIAEGTIDGSNWYRAIADSLAITNVATQTKIIQIPTTTAFSKIRWTCTGGTTGNLTPTGYAIWRRQ